jgi:hypothetical protein
LSHKGAQKAQIIINVYCAFCASLRQLKKGGFEAEAFWPGFTIRKVLIYDPYLSRKELYESKTYIHIRYFVCGSVKRRGAGMDAVARSGAGWICLRKEHAGCLA